MMGYSGRQIADVFCHIRMMTEKLLRKLQAIFKREDLNAG